jgi:glucokinase
MRNFLGIEIGGTKLQVVVGNENAHILERLRFDVDPSAGADGIQNKIKEALRNLNLDATSGIGVGFGGPVDHRTGTISISHQIPGWSGFSIQNWLQELTGIHVWVENDANVGAFGEALHGAGKNFQHVFYVTIGSGVGAGLVVNKNIYHGAIPGEAEFGHIRLDKNGKTVESSCSGWAMDAKIREYVRLYPESVLSQLTRGYSNGEARLLGTALKADDKPSLAILEETVEDLAFGLSHAVHLLHPETIILGGGLSLIGEPFRRLVEKRLPDYIMNVFQPGPAIQLSALKEDAVPVGALALAINKLNQV